MAEEKEGRIYNVLPKLVEDPRQIAADKSKGFMSIGAQKAIEQDMVDPRSGEIRQTYEVPLDAASKFQARDTGAAWYMGEGKEKDTPPPTR